jgi:hypothetical protein
MAWQISFFAQNSRQFAEGCSIAAIRWDENAGLRRDAVRSQVIDALEAQKIKETGNEED